MKSTVQILFGACVVYSLVTACGGSNVGSVSDGGILDALSNPSRDAQASSPQTIVESCSVDLGGYLLVEHSFPGMTVADLANVKVLLRLKTPYNGGYTHKPASGEFIFLQDGKIGAYCSNPTGDTIDSVVFIVPN